jgi:hypothetical protein
MASIATAQDEGPKMIPAPDRGAEEGGGPYGRLIIRGATLIDGTGSPPRGPVDIVIENNRIVDVTSVGYPGLEIDESKRPTDATREIDAHGQYVMPGIIDMHTHTGGSTKAPEAEYSYKLWMGHGITTVRGVPSSNNEFSLSEKARSARNEIVAPRIFSYHRPGSGEEFSGRKILTADDAREWVRYIAAEGADGLKLGSYRPVIMEALLDEAKKQGLGSTAHLGQMGVAQMNAQDSARLGLGTLTHYYGLFESMYEDHDVQPWPVDMNYNNEQHRFGQVARQWNLIMRYWKNFLNSISRLTQLSESIRLVAMLCVFAMPTGTRNTRCRHSGTFTLRIERATAPIGSTGRLQMRLPGKISIACGCSSLMTTRIWAVA